MKDTFSLACVSPIIIEGGTDKVVGRLPKSSSSMVSLAKTGMSSSVRARYSSYIPRIRSVSQALDIVRLNPCLLQGTLMIT